MEQKKDFKDFLCSGVGKAGMIVVFYAVIFGLFMLTMQLFGNAEMIGIVYAVIFGVFGWKALSRIQPSIFLFMPIGGWVIYFIVKGVLAITIGIFVAPFVIAKKVAETVQANI